MKTDVSLKCKCGAFRGLVHDVSPFVSMRVVCMCDDCQAYAHYLGRAEDVLDANGGTDIFQMWPSNFKITQGVEQLRCLQYPGKDTGLLRWYTGCCHTPIGNTSGNPKMPFVGVVHSIMDHAADGQTRDATLGPVFARIQAKFAIGTPPPGSLRKGNLKVVANAVKIIGLGFVLRKNKPSPFFDDEGKPKAQPYTLTHEERENLRPLCGPKP